MKAEHRKELQTNLLADKLGRLMQSLREGTWKVHPSTKAWIITAAVVAVVALLIGWRFYSSSVTKSASAEWIRIDDAASLADLEKIVEQDPTGKASRAVRFQMARIFLRRGMEHFVSTAPNARADALGDLNKAAEQYSTLADQVKDTPLLEQEALMGVAKVKEALNELDAARDAYQKLASKYPQSVNGKEAAKRLSKLENEKDKVLVAAFYKKLDELAKPPAPPPSPPKKD
jgi:hypothetical protein